MFGPKSDAYDAVVFWRGPFLFYGALGGLVLLIALLTHGGIMIWIGAGLLCLSVVWCIGFLIVALWDEDIGDL